MTKTAIKFTYSGTEILFDLGEVMRESVMFLQDLTVQESQSQPPMVFCNGAEYTTIDIEFDEVSLETFTKIQALKSVTEELTLYYRHAYDGGLANIKVIPVVDDDTEVWQFGEMATQVTHKMSFLISG